MKFHFPSYPLPKDVDVKDWESWTWQIRHLQDPFAIKSKSFRGGATPYYLHLIKNNSTSRLVDIIKTKEIEEKMHGQQMEDPLGEAQHTSSKRLIHRYPDRVLFLVTDFCGVYCRFCFRKHFTGKKQGLIKKDEIALALEYIKKNPGIREVILSGGDPLTLSDGIIERLLQNIRDIPHIEIIRIASRLPVVCPMRIQAGLIRVLKKYQPVFLMTHFNHPAEISKDVADALTRLADAGILMFNQMVLLNGINNHPSLVQALARRLLYLRVKPYYMFQCDPSLGTEHFRTNIENSEWIQSELWGRLSGLASHQLSLDIPGGGGKVGLVPDFLENSTKTQRSYKGFDGRSGSYLNPDPKTTELPPDIQLYEKEWLEIKNQTYGIKN